MAKKKKSSDKKERKVHKVSFKREPIWLKMNIIGKYEGIKYRFTYKEYCNDEADEVIKNFVFTWPGRIPENKEVAEQGIKSLFLKALEGDTFSYKVVKDTIDDSSTKEEEAALLGELDNENYNHDV